MQTQNETLSVYFDGLCPLCSREIDQYRKASGSNKISFVDITDDGFDAIANGLDPKSVHEVMHVKTGTGDIQIGVDAFIAIWQTLPDWNWLARLAKNPLLRPFLNGGYYVFAKIRPFLPRKTKGCEQSPYCETPRNL